MPSIHIGQRGILCSNTSGLIVSADTLCLHCVQDAVAKDPSIKDTNINTYLLKKYIKTLPWHSITFSMPTTCSKVSMFWV